MFTVVSKLKNKNIMNLILFPYLKRSELSQNRTLTDRFELQLLSNICYPKKIVPVCTSNIAGVQTKDNKHYMSSYDTEKKRSCIIDWDLNLFEKAISKNLS